MKNKLHNRNLHISRLFKEEKVNIRDTKVYLTAFEKKWMYRNEDEQQCLLPQKE